MNFSTDWVAVHWYLVYCNAFEVFHPILFYKHFLRIAVFKL